MDLNFQIERTPQAPRGVRDIHPLREDCCQSSETEDEKKILIFFRGQRRGHFEN